MRVLDRVKDKLASRQKGASSRPATPVAALSPAQVRPCVSDSAAVDTQDVASQDQSINIKATSADLWARAWNKLQQEHGDDARAMETFLQRSVSRSGNPGDGSQIANEISAAQDLYERDHEVSQKIKSTLHTIVSVVKKGSDIIALAVSSNPIASSVWTGVSLVIPLLMRPGEQNQAALTTLQECIELLQCYQSYQHLLQEEDDSIVQDARDRIVDLYYQVILFEAQLISHRDQHMGHRLIQNLKNDWLSTSQKLKDLDSAFTRQLEILRARWQREEQRRRRDLEQSKQIDDTISSIYVGFRYPEGERLAGTGRWFLRRSEFLSWRLQQFALLWMTADAGCGKSMLAKYLIDSRTELFGDSHTVKRSIVIFYFFNDGQSYSKATNALCSFLNQILTELPKHASIVEDYCRKRGMSTRDLLNSEVHVLWDLFLDVVSAASADYQIVCIIDALDECDPGSIKALLTRLDSLYSGQRPKQLSIRCLITSRPYRELRMGLKRSLKISPDIRVDVAEEQESLKAEINIVIGQRVREIAEDKRLTDNSRDELQKALCSVEHRTYLWLYLVLEHFDNDWDHAGQNIANFIGTLPQSLERKYSQILERMNSEHLSNASRIFKIMLAAYRPLNSDEAYHALRIRPSTCKTGELSSGTTQTTSELIRDICALFVTVDGNNHLYFIHQTARDYLLEQHPAKIDEHDLHPTLDAGKLFMQHSLNFKACHTVLADACVGYIFLEEVRQSPAYGASRFGVTDVGPIDYGGRWLENLPLIEYAAAHWMRHTYESSCSSQTVLSRQVDLLDHQSSLFWVWYQIYCKLTPRRLDPRTTGLMLASCHGLCEIVKVLVSTSMDVIDKVSNPYGTALQTASYQGHTRVVKMLLEKGADTETEGGDWGNAIQAASKKGHAEVVRLLIENGADMYKEGNNTRSALLAASLGGHTAVMQLLIDSEPNMVARAQEYEKALCAASRRGRIDIVKLLLAKGVDANAVDIFWRSAVQAALENGHPEIVKMLLDHGATWPATSDSD